MFAVHECVDSPFVIRSEYFLSAPRVAVCGASLVTCIQSSERRLCRYNRLSSTRTVEHLDLRCPSATYTFNRVARHRSYFEALDHAEQKLALVEASSLRAHDALRDEVSSGDITLRRASQRVQLLLVSSAYPGVAPNRILAESV